MYDLEKLEKKFHEFIKPSPNIKYPDLSEIKITEKLLEKREIAYIPFGDVTYFLVIEDEKPVIYAHAVTRMDLDSICFITEEGYECYDIFEGGNEEIVEKFYAHQRILNPDLKGIPGKKIF